MNTINVNDFDVPEPLKEIPPYTTHVWRSEPGHPEFCTRWTAAWIHPELENGRVHLTKEAAQAHGKALCGIDPSN